MVVEAEARPDRTGGPETEQVGAKARDTALGEELAHRVPDAPRSRQAVKKQNIVRPAGRGGRERERAEARRALRPD